MHAAQYGVATLALFVYDVCIVRSSIDTDRPACRLCMCATHQELLSGTRIHMAKHVYAPDQSSSSFLAARLLSPQRSHVFEWQRRVSVQARQRPRSTGLACSRVLGGSYERADDSTLAFVRFKSQIHARGAKTWTVCKQDHELIDLPSFPRLTCRCHLSFLPTMGLLSVQTKSTPLTPYPEKQPDPETYAHHLMPG